VDPAGGGPIEAIKQLGKALEGAGHSVEIAAMDAPNAMFLKECDLSVHALGPTTSKYGYNSRLVPWLKSNHNRYDAVIVNGLWQYHSFGAWRALRNSDTPYVVYTHGMLDPWFKKQYPLKHLKKWMYWPWAEYRVLRDARAVLFTCEEERNQARTSFWLYRCTEAVVGLGTTKPNEHSDQEIKGFLARYPKLQGKKVALFMGRVHPKKGCDLLIEAFAAVLKNDPEWELVIVGPDEVGWMDKLNRLAEELGVAERITWTGMLSGGLKWGALRSSEVFVLPSHQENFGIAVAEALAVGVPVLISNKVNIWREVRADEAGIVAEDTLTGTCALLKSYVGMPAEKKLAMRQNAESSFIQRFEIEKAAKNLMAVLSRIAALHETKHHDELVQQVQTRPIVSTHRTENIQ